MRLVRHAIRGSMWVSRSRRAPSTTPPPPPHRRNRNRCPRGECCVCRKFSTPSDVGFPAKAELAVGRVAGGLCGGDGAGQWHRYHNRRRRTVDCWHPVLAACGKMWVVPRGGALRVADVERRGWGQVRRRRWGGTIP